MQEHDELRNFDSLLVTLELLRSASSLACALLTESSATSQVGGIRFEAYK